jgi:hypothetical protein
MGQFTPGPWCVEDPMAPESLWVVQAGKESYEWFAIAVCDMPDEDDHLFVSAEVHANARLIAAAPDLLAALQNLVSLQADAAFTPVDVWLARTSAHYSAAREAIAKATGPSAPSGEAA